MRKNAIIISMQSVLIVGASSGIGYACAKKFIVEGYEVLALSRTECVLAGVKNYLCDVSNESELDLTLNALLAENPRIVHCLRRLIPALRHSSGSACVVSSVGSLFPIPFDPYYVSSKAALNAFCAALQTELRPKGVRVLSVMPGGTRTDFTFKRKIYSNEKTGDYSVAVKTASEKLKEIEQQGASANKVAEEIYNKCAASSAFYLFAAGLKNKLACALIRFLPQPLLTMLTRAVFLSSPGPTER